jgi:hypothetical protein
MIVKLPQRVNIATCGRKYAIAREIPTHFMRATNDKWPAFDRESYSCTMTQDATGWREGASRVRDVDLAVRE